MIATGMMVIVMSTDTTSHIPYKYP